MAQETILVVDADEKSQKLLEVSFKKEGYEVLLTETIKDAIKTIGTQSPDLIICDTDLPDGDGFTLCEQLKRNPNFASIPFLFLTEDEELSRKMKAFELGAAEYLTKPIFIKDVTSRVKLQIQELNKHRIDQASDDEVVTGSLDEITVIDLLQTIESRDRSGILKLEREQGITAEISFQKGNILDADCGPLRGEEALYRIMLWPKGTFSLEYKEVHSADHIEKDSSALLIEGMRRFESWNDMIGTLPHLSRVFKTANDAPTSGIPPEVEGLLALFDGTRSLRHVVDQSPLDDLTTLRIIRKLLDETLIEDVTSDESSLRQSAQHTNLATWLSDRTVRDEQGQRRRARLFDTTPGFKSVPGLNADSIVESEEQINEVARTLDEISSPPTAADLEEGQAPESSPGEEEDSTHWRFHWDQEAGEAVATPREKPADPFALNDLEKDLARIEQMRREEEARRIAAERDYAAQQQPPLAQPSSSSLQSASASPSEPEAPREITKELHRESVLAEVERRKQEATKDPRAGIEDLIDRVEQKPSDSFADQVARDYADGEDQFVSRQRTDQFIPVLDAPISQDEIETAEIEREEPEPTSDTPSSPLVPLGAPEDSSDEPTVSEEAAEAYKAGVALDQQSIEEADTGEEEREEFAKEESLEDEESAPELEEFFPEEEAKEEASAQDDEDEAGISSQAEDFIAHRTPRNQELVHAEVELKRGSDDTPDEDLEEDEDDAPVTHEDPEEEDTSSEEESAIAAATTEDEDDEPEPQQEEEAAPVTAATTEDDNAKEDEEEEEEGYLLDAPLFADEEEGFNKGGLLAVGLVIVALIAVIFFALDNDDDKNKKPTDPVVAAKLDAAPDLKEAEPDAAPDLTAVAVADAAPDLPTFVAREVTQDNAPDMGQLFGDHTHTQTASMVLSLSGTDMSTVTDPVATLNASSVTSDAADMPADMATATNTPDAGQAVATNDPPKTDPPKSDPPKTDPPKETKPESVDDQLKSVASMIRRGKYKPALKPARALVKAAPDNGKAAGLLGSAELNGANDARAAIKSFERAQRLGYRSSTMYLDMGTAYQLTGQKDKARKTYEKFLKAYPKHKSAKDIQSIVDNQL